ncbi:DUF2339 domain-containing protein [soil metagenome]
MQDENENKLQELIKKIAEINEQQQQIQKELLQINQIVYDLRRAELRKEVIKPLPVIPAEAKETSQPVVKIPTLLQEIAAKHKENPVPKKSNRKETPMEEFIGTNLLNKVGIAILVLGIGYGVKYSIDHNLLNPLTRIILGYLSGGVLIGLALKLKTKYARFSAVLLSGGMASLYFITYAAYDFYGFFPLTVAFVLMVIFTLFTVVAALHYQLQVIAIIGLVGAYAVPFLLSDGSGRVNVLFSYMTIINSGILLLSFKKNWRALYYLSFFLTWIIFSTWWASDYTSEKHLFSSLLFSTIFFVQFYITTLSYKLIREDSFGRGDVIMILLNSFIYFGFGYSSIDDLEVGELYLGIFTVFTALLHFIASSIIYKKKEQHKDIFYFVAGLVIVFLTIAVPVQLEGNWVTLIWAAEGLMIFAIARMKSLPIYETLSYPIIAIAFLSLLQDWSEYYVISDAYIQQHAFLLNSQFLTSLLVSLSLTAVLWLSQQEKYKAPYEPVSTSSILFNLGIAILMLITIYFMFYLEIASFFEQRYFASSIKVPGNENLEYVTQNYDIPKFKNLWLINYSAFFGLMTSLFTISYLNKEVASVVSILFNIMVLAAFTLTGLMHLAELRTSYLGQVDANIYSRDFASYIGFRYVCILFTFPLIWANRKILQRKFFNPYFGEVEKALLNLFVIILLSSELIHWLDMARIENSDKLALSILWGLYALAMIVRGLMKHDRVIRIMGIVLFGITIIKLFVYDISNMSTIAKTIVMMTLGALMLIASFLYNKAQKSAKNEE